jgi:hypothetical protein
MERQSEAADRSTGSVGKLPYEAPVLRGLPIRSTMTADLAFETEGTYTDGPFAGRTFGPSGPPASV